MSKNIKGLTSLEVKRSFELYGDNSLKKEKSKSFLRRFIENLSDPIIRILLIALTVQVLLTLGNCNFVEIIGILAAILISTTVSTVSEYKSECAFEKLEQESLSSFVSVLRDGEICTVKSFELVVGDIVYVSAGEKIQADGTVISGRVSVDQSALNGESVDVIKERGNGDGWDLSSLNRLFRGSIVKEGSCVMRVDRVGTNTYYGMVAKDIQAETRISPLKLRLSKLAKQVTRLGYVIAAVVGLAYLFNTIVVDNGFVISKIVESIKDYKYFFSVLLHTLTLMITVIVVAAPEGLPMMITVVLSANTKRMLAEGVHVKKLVGIDTAGSLNILFTDKTGTLTVGKPQCDRIITVEGVFGGISSLKKTGAIYEALVLSSKYNSDVVNVNGNSIGGNSTDRAIYDFFFEEVAPVCTVISKTSFNSDLKFSSVTFKNGKTLIKGAAETIFARCKYTIRTDGTRCELKNADITKEYKNAIMRGERVICVAYNEGSESELTFIAFIVLKDKLRAGVREVVRDVARAGVQIVMVTGDGKETATAIAEECGLFCDRAGHIVLGSDELNKMTDTEIKKILPKLRVVSRALPQDKTRLVRLSQELDLVVGMTGDGINDSPSLKLADVGFAMGSGTDIAKSSADIVILDDSLSAIAKTILYGRTIFKSIRKFITFQLIMNLAACGVSLVGQFIGIDTPITIIQMLWVNIIMDTLGGLAFAGEPPLDYYMREKPNKRDEPILSPSMLNHIAFSGAYTLLLCIVFLSSYIFKDIYCYSLSPMRFYTAFYALFIFAGIFNCFAARCERLWLLSNIGKNKPFVFIMFLISVIQIFMIYFGGQIFRCTPLEVKELFVAISLAFTVIPFDLVRRAVYKLK